ncbi:MAG: DUF1795 domain-containing protein [Actinomycetota bacterium]|nr:DUF1795 domain-containing protein [Actinomycetota bacterium]
MSCALGCTIAVAGCGGSPAHRRPGKIPETADAPPPLPRGWHRITETRSGFTLGLPPGWTSRSENAATRARSRDGAAALSVFADRSRDGQEDAPEEYLRRTIAHFSGYRALHVGPVRPLPGLAYPAAKVTASGVFAKTKVRQRIALYALRRPRQVTYTVAVFRSASSAGSRETALLERIVRSLRGRPPRL